jgi:hypothetical protein
MDARTSIKTIIEQDAAFCQDVSVTICRTLPTVTIKDQSGINEDIFMQGEDAQEFIDALDGLVETAPDDVLFADAMKHLALPWVECCWN